MNYWKDIPGFEGLYRINRVGQVMSLPKESGSNKYMTKMILMTPVNHDKGYHKVRLRKGGKYYNRYIHRLVAQSFIANPNNKPQVNHINGNKLDNSTDNLEWVTPGENISHAYRINLIPRKKRMGLGGDNPRSIGVDQLSLNGVLIRSFLSIADAAREYGFNAGGICECAKGRRKYHRGFLWRYNEL